MISLLKNVTKQQHHTQAFDELVGALNSSIVSIVPYTSKVVAGGREPAHRQLISTTLELLEALAQQEPLRLDAGMSRAWYVPLSFLIQHRHAPGLPWPEWGNPIMKWVLQSRDAGVWDATERFSKMLLRSLIQVGVQIMRSLSEKIEMDLRMDVAELMAMQFFDRLFCVVSLQLDSWFTANVVSDPIELHRCFQIAYHSHRLDIPRVSCVSLLHLNKRLLVVCSHTTLRISPLLVDSTMQFLLNLTMHNDKMNTLIQFLVPYSNASFVEAIAILTRNDPTAHLGRGMRLLLYTLHNSCTEGEELSSFTLCAYDILNQYVSKIENLRVEAGDSDGCEDAFMPLSMFLQLFRNMDKCVASGWAGPRAEKLRVLCNLPGSVIRLETLIRASHDRNGATRTSPTHPDDIVKIMLCMIHSARMSDQSIPAHISLAATLRKVLLLQAPGTRSIVFSCLSSLRYTDKLQSTYLKELQLHFAGILSSIGNLALLSAPMLQRIKLEAAACLKSKEMQQVFLGLMDDRTLNKREHAREWMRFLTTSDMRWPLVRRCGNWLCVNLAGLCDSALPSTLCSACRRVRYCSIECQREAWRDGHSSSCNSLH